MCRVILIFVSLLLSACSIREANKDAYLERFKPLDESIKYQVVITVPTGDGWHFSIHGGIFQSHNSYSIILPNKPSGKSVYKYSELKVVKGYPRKEIEILSGFIEVEPDFMEAIISLTTNEGEFKGNGMLKLSFKNF